MSYIFMLFDIMLVDIMTHTHMYIGNMHRFCIRLMCFIIHKFARVNIFTVVCVEQQHTPCREICYPINQSWSVYLWS